jgi:hypothetical protein
MAILTLGIPTMVIAILSILLGIFILLLPKILRWAVGLYFIIAGLVALLGLWIR